MRQNLDKIQDVGESILFLKTERDANTCRNLGFAPKWNSQIPAIFGQKAEKLHTQYLADWWKIQWGKTYKVGYYPSLKYEVMMHYRIYSIDAMLTLWDIWMGKDDS